jgi:hypothetical protein
MPLRLALALSVLAFHPLPTWAQDKEKPKPAAAEPQKQFAIEAMKMADVKDGRVVETDRLVVATPLPEPKAKALADSLEKTYAVASKALKFELADEKAKLVVFTFTDLDQYRQFKRSVIKERPDDGETASHDVRRDDPYVAVSARRGEKNPNFEAVAAEEISRALLAKKGGNARLPDWMKSGFARAVQMRTDPKSVGGDRAAVLRLAPRLAKGSKGFPPVADKAWTGMGKERDLVAASLMDFLTFGPGSEKLGTVMSALVPTAGVDEPTFAAALTGDWSLEDLDRSWREWIHKGSPVAK